MKKNIIYLFIGVLLLLLTASCAPQLARTQYGATEQQWKDYIRESYKDWEPPPTPPPINDSTASSNKVDNFNISIVPEAMPENTLEVASIDSSQKILPVLANNINTPQGTPETVMYTVQKGDTLWSISCKFFDNDGSKWKRIQEANKDILPNPASIKPGLTLTIPSN